MHLKIDVNMCIDKRRNRLAGAGILLIFILLAARLAAQKPAAENTADYIHLLKNVKTGLTANHSVKNKFSALTFSLLTYIFALTFCDIKQ